MDRRYEQEFSCRMVDMAIGMVVELVLRCLDARDGL